MNKCVKFLLAFISCLLVLVFSSISTNAYWEQESSANPTYYRKFNSFDYYFTYLGSGTNDKRGTYQINLDKFVVAAPNWHPQYTFDYFSTNGQTNGQFTFMSDYRIIRDSDRKICIEYDYYELNSDGEMYSVGFTTDYIWLSFADLKRYRDCVVAQDFIDDFWLPMFNLYGDFQHEPMFIECDYSYSIYEFSSNDTPIDNGGGSIQTLNVVGPAEFHSTSTISFEPTADNPNDTIWLSVIDYDLIDNWETTFSKYHYYNNCYYIKFDTSFKVYRGMPSSPVSVFPLAGFKTRENLLKEEPVDDFIARFNPVSFANVNIDDMNKLFPSLFEGVTKALNVKIFGIFSVLDVIIVLVTIPFGILLLKLFLGG